jgi:hypothetical protein
MRRKGVLAPRGSFTPGYDIAGEVVEIGAGVADTEVGDRVACLAPKTGLGGYQSEICIAEKLLARVPGGLEFSQAASLGLNYITAYELLHRIAKLTAGDSTVDVHLIALGLAAAGDDGDRDRVRPKVEGDGRRCAAGAHDNTIDQDRGIGVEGCRGDLDLRDQQRDLYLVGGLGRVKGWDQGRDSRDHEVAQVRGNGRRQVSAGHRDIADVSASDDSGAIGDQACLAIGLGRDSDCVARSLQQVARKCDVGAEAEKDGFVEAQFQGAHEARDASADLMAGFDIGVALRRVGPCRVVRGHRGIRDHLTISSHAPSILCVHARLPLSMRMERGAGDYRLPPMDA